MPAQRGQSSRQSPACHFDVGGGRSRQPAVPPFAPPCGRLPPLSSCPGHLLKRLLCGAGSRGHKFSLRRSAAGRVPTCPGQRRAPGGGHRRGHRGAPPEGPPAAWSHGGGLAESHPPALGWPRALAGIFLFPAGKAQRRGKEQLRQGKWHFPPKCENRRANPLPFSVLLGRAGERSGAGAMGGDRGSWGQPAAPRRRSPLPVGPAGVAGAAGARGPLRQPGFRGLF